MRRWKESMKYDYSFNVIDTHTGGETTRIVMSGIPYIHCNTMNDYYEYMRDHYDWLRTLICQEPRGSNIMSGAIVTTPCNPNANVGVIFFESKGWTLISGHSTIGVCTALIELGLVKINEPVTKIVLDSPLGLISAKVNVTNGKASKVTFTNFPSFTISMNNSIRVNSWDKITLDIAWGGTALAIIPANCFGLEINAKNSKEFVKISQELMPIINDKFRFCHPLLPDIHGISQIEFVDEKSNYIMKSIVVSHTGSTNRSACGNATSARAAVLYDKGKLSIGDSFYQYGCANTNLNCKLVEKHVIDGIDTVITDISGNAWIIAISTMIASKEDPFYEGFILM